MVVVIRPDPSSPVLPFRGFARSFNWRAGISKKGFLEVLHICSLFKGGVGVRVVMVERGGIGAVSYTHLTLPTTPYV